MTNRYIGLDLETESLEAKTNPSKMIWCAGFAELVDGQYKKRCLPWYVAKAEIEELLKDESVIFILHNSAFDIACLRVRDVNIPSGRYICTRLMAYTSDTQEQNGLDFLARTYLKDKKQPLKERMIESGLLTKKQDVWQLDYNNNADASKLLYEYCEHDAVLCLNLFYWLLENRYAENEKLTRAFFGVELPYIEVIMDMEATGMYVDTSLLDELKNIIDEEEAELNGRINSEIGLLPVSVRWDAAAGKYTVVEKSYIGGVNKNKNNGDIHYSTGVEGQHSSSNPSMVYDHCEVEQLNTEKSHFAWYLMELRGWVPNVYSKKTGEPTMNKIVMLSLTNEYPVLEDIKQRRDIMKLRDSFINKMVSIAASGDEPFVRCDYNQAKTITTRLSSSNPNLQNIPARSKLGKRIRDSVVAPDGYQLWVADLDSIELVVLAFYLKMVVGESRMYDALEGGADLHQVNADAWGLEKRADAKKIFSVIYGGGAAAVGKYGNNGTKEEGQVILDKMKEGMPAIWELMDAVWSTARKRGGLIYTWFGVPLYYPDLCSKDHGKRARAERQSFNALIQGTAAGINKELGIQLSDLLWYCGGHFSAAVHDEYLCVVPVTHHELFKVEANIIYDCRSILTHDGWSLRTGGTWNTGKDWNEAKG
jgi:DNA polymerase I-like protein with 3'-5' exonuclease and polymerase domains